MKELYGGMSKIELAMKIAKGDGEISSEIKGNGIDDDMDGIAL